MDLSKIYSNEFNTLKNKNAWDILHSHIADVLITNEVPVDNVFFVNTPGFIVLYSNYDKTIIQKPASEFSNFTTRRVIFEKSNKNKTFHYINQHTNLNQKVVSIPLSVMTYRLNWNESLYGESYDLMKSLKTFFKSKSHLPIFLYADGDFFDTLKQTKMIRVATLNLSEF